MRVLPLIVTMSLVITACAGPADKAREGGMQQQLRALVLKKDAQVLFGNPGYCSLPATIDLKKVQAATLQGQTIAEEGLKPGTARYRLLHAQMHKLVIEACAETARDEGFDLIVRDGDIKDAGGRPVGNMTKALVKRLRDGP